MSLSSSRPTVVLPQPDSPTRPSVSPRAISRSTPSTARTSATVRCSTPALMGNAFLRPSRRTSGRASAEPSPSEALRCGPYRRSLIRRDLRPAAYRPLPASSRDPVADAVLMVVQPAAHEVAIAGRSASSGWARSARTLPCSSRATQRGANRQPSGSSMRLGTEPGMVASSSTDLAGHGHGTDEPARVGVLGVREERLARRSARRSPRRTSPPLDRTSRRRRPGRG